MRYVFVLGLGMVAGGVVGWGLMILGAPSGLQNIAAMMAGYVAALWYLLK